MSKGQSMSDMSAQIRDHTRVELRAGVRRFIRPWDFGLEGQ